MPRCVATEGPLTAPPLSARERLRCILSSPWCLAKQSERPMFLQFPYPMPPDLPGGAPIGQDGQVILLVLVCFLLVVILYLFFGLSADLMSEEFWVNLKDFHRIYLRARVRI